MEGLDSQGDINKLTDRLLRRASAYGRFPTPIDDIVAAANLTEPSESMLSSFILKQAPDYIRRAVARVSTRVRAVLDRKQREIHLHPDVENAGQRTFKRLHEVTHDLLPWQSELAYADDDSTLRWSTKVLFEREANQGAAELLFQRDYFSQMANDYAVSLASVVELSQTFGASIHASFRRYVETHKGAVAGIVLDHSPCAAEPLAYRRRESMESTAFREHFPELAAWPRVLDLRTFEFLSAVRGAVNRIQTLDGLVKVDVSGDKRRLNIELFDNTYSIFVLVWQPKREWFRRRVVLAHQHESPAKIYAQRS